MMKDTMFSKKQMNMYIKATYVGKTNHMFTYGQEYPVLYYDREKVQVGMYNAFEVDDGYDVDEVPIPSTYFPWNTFETCFKSMVVSTNHKRNQRRKNHRLKKKKLLNIVKGKFGSEFLQEALSDNAISNLYGASYGCRCYICQGGVERASVLRRKAEMMDKLTEYRQGGEYL